VVVAVIFGCDTIKFRSSQGQSNPPANTNPSPTVAPGSTTPGSTIPGQYMPGQSSPGILTAGTTFNPSLSPVPGQGVLQVPTQTNPNVIDFNSIVGQGFHIGNGAFEGSSCKIMLTLKPVVGTTYNFHFRVLQNGTMVTAQITSLCGVDTGSDTGAPVSSFSDPTTDFAFFMPMNGSSTPIEAFR